MTGVVSDWKNVNVKLQANTLTTVYSATLSASSGCWWFIDTSVQLSSGSTTSYASWYSLEIHLRESPDAAWSATYAFPSRQYSSRNTLMTMGWFNANQIIDIRVKSEYTRTCEYALFRATRIFN